MFKEPSDVNRFKTTCLMTLKDRAKILMQKGFHSNSQDPQGTENLSRVDELTLQLEMPLMTGVPLGKSKRKKHLRERKKHDSSYRQRSVRSFTRR